MAAALWASLTYQPPRPRRGDSMTFINRPVPSVVVALATWGQAPADAAAGLRTG